MRRFAIILMMVCCAHFSRAQSDSHDTIAKKPPVNQYDADGTRIGLWYIAHPERMGEEPFTEFGTFDKNKKTGAWCKIDWNGEVSAIENFRYDILDGEVQYFEQGVLTCVGHYRALNPAFPNDTLLVDDPVTGYKVERIIPTERGSLKHGTWRFYDAATGRLIREQEYQVDELISEKEFPYSHADSVYYEKREKNLPHNKKPANLPPGHKQFDYMKD